MNLRPITRSKEFIPEFMKNREEKAENQIKVIFKRYPSAGEIGLYKSFRFKNGATEVVYSDAIILSNHIESIKNLSIGGSAIDTAEKLMEAEDSRLYDLIVEIRNYLLKDSEDLESGE
jgi:hypothetical protein